MNNEKFITLAAKSLSGEAGVEELNELKELLKSEKYFSEYELLKTNWNKLELPEEYTQFDLHVGLKNLHNKINEFTILETKVLRKISFGNAIYSNYFLRIAASIVFLTIVSLSVLYFTGNIIKSVTTAELNIKTTLPGQKSIITLLDGTSITLNSDSKLRFPKNFSGNTREVYLEGEAYFEVAHGPSSPFIVHSGNFDVTVLGTVFDVKAFPNENIYSVSLVNGKVNVTNAFLEGGTFVLKPDEQFSFDKTTGKNKIGNFDNQQVTGWKDNILIFDNTKLSDVLVQLERAYGIGFKLENESYGNLKIKADFRNASFWTIVKVLKTAAELDYKTVSNNNKELQKIIFYKK